MGGRAWLALGGAVLWAACLDPSPDPWPSRPEAELSDGAEADDPAASAGGSSLDEQFAGQMFVDAGAKRSPPTPDSWMPPPAEADSGLRCSDAGLRMHYTDSLGRNAVRMDAGFLEK